MSADIEKAVRECFQSVSDNRPEICIAGTTLATAHGQDLLIRGTVRNAGLSAWPIMVGGSRVLRLGAELHTRAGKKVAVSRTDLDGEVFAPGESRTFEIRLPTSHAEPGEASVVVDLLYERVAWFHKNRASCTWTVSIAPEAWFTEIDASLPVDDPRFWKQHVPGFSPSTGIGIASPQFQTYEIENPSGPVRARSMLTMYELSLLYALARHYASGAGEIVDLGPLIGVGTNAFARGLTENGDPATQATRIYSYDLFLFDNMGHFLPQTDHGGTKSVFRRYLDINRDYLDRIVPVPGDFIKMQWTGQPIEILFVDLAKSWALNAKVVREFFRHLIPGRSILVQQDYVHVGEPWIALTMEYLADFFEPLYFVYGASAVYRLRKPIPEATLAADLASLPDPVIRELFACAKAKATQAVAQVLACCEAAIWIERGQLLDARRLIDSVDLSAADRLGPSEEFAPAISPNLSAVRKWLEGAERGEKIHWGSVRETGASLRPVVPRS